MRLPRGTRGGTCGRRGARRGRPPRRPGRRSVRQSVRPSAGARRAALGGTRCWVTPARPRRRRGDSGCRGAAPAAAQPTVCRAGDFSREIFGGSAGSGAGGQRVFGSESESAEGASLPKGPINPSAAPSRPGKAPASARPAPRSLRPRVRRPPRLSQPRVPTQPRRRPGSPARPGPAGAGAPDTGPAFQPRSRLDLSFRRDGTPLWRRKPRCCCCCCYRLYKSQCRPLILTAG